MGRCLFVMQDQYLQGHKAIAFENHLFQC
jgi:hypothetical protein